MADYNPILDAETDPEAGLRSSLFKRLRANPIAIAEGAVGAPRVQPKAVFSPGILGDAGITGTSWIAVTGLDGIKTICLTAGTDSGTSASLNLQFSADGGSTWGGSQLIFGTGGNTAASGSWQINLATGAMKGGYVLYPSSGASTVSSSDLSLTVPANCNAIRFTFNHSSRTFWGHVALLGGFE